MQIPQPALAAVPGIGRSASLLYLWVLTCRMYATRRAAKSHCHRQQALQRVISSACAMFNRPETCNALIVGLQQLALLLQHQALSN